MKILFNTSNFPKYKGEATTPFIFTLAKTINEEHCIHILAPHEKKSKKFEKWDNISIFRYQYIWPSDLEVLFNKGGALVNLRKNPIKYLLIFPFFISQLFSLFIINKKNDYDAINSHWLIPQGLSGILVAKLFKIPHIVSVHGSDLFSLNNKFFLFLKKIVLNNSDYIICNSYFTEKELIKRFKKYKNKIIVIPVPIEEEYFFKKTAVLKNNNLIKQLSIEKDTKIIVFIGRVVEEKGLGLIIRGLSYMDKVCKNIKWKLIVGGDGKDLLKFKKLAKSLNIDKKIKFLGWLDTKKVADLLSIADLFVGISLSGKEGFGLTYLEAIISGVPIISSNEIGLLSYFDKDQIDTLEIRVLNRPYSDKKIGREIMSQLNKDKNKNLNTKKLSLLKPFSKQEILKQYVCIYESLKKNDYKKI